MTSPDSFKSRVTLDVDGQKVVLHRLDALQKAGVGHVEKLPYSIRVLLENLLRNEDGKSVTQDDIRAVASWDAKAKPTTEIAFRPSRVLLQDFTGVPAVVDLAAMREQFARMGGDPSRINPLQPADLVIDHSVQVDSYGLLRSFEENVKREFERNQERYQFLKWGQSALKNMRVVPPGTGIVHQVNLEYLASVVFTRDEAGALLAYPDSLVGTDSHTTMINGLGVLGWGVGGIEAEAAMLGQPIAMLVPQVVGFKLTGKLREGATATDAVLTVVEMLRAKGVVGKFVEFFGPGMETLSLPDRATIANMAPEYGATMGFFPVDAETLAYLRFTNRDEKHVALCERVLKEQGLFHTADAPDPEFSDTLELDLGDVVPSIAGPKRPQDRIALTDAKSAYQKVEQAVRERLKDSKTSAEVTLERDGTKETFQLDNGAIVIAAITSCTNTSNPAVMLAAGLVARNAVAKGLQVKPWVKTSLAPGSQVVTEYLKESKLLDDLEKLRFNLVGYGCTTCIGNSGPLDGPIAKAIEDNNLVVTSALSGNRNFEGRVSPHTRANYLASPPLVVAYALAGTMNIDFEKEPIGKGSDGKDVFLKGHLAVQRRADRDASERGEAVAVRRSLRRGLPGPRAVACRGGADRRHLRVGRCVDLHPQPALLRRGRSRRPAPGEGHRGCARARAARRHGHHRPHLTGRCDRQRQPGCAVPEGARGLAARLQQLRKPPRQPRGDDARHVRQHPPSQPARARHRGWHHASPSQWRADVDLRRRDEVHRRRHPARRHRRQGVRHRFVA